MRELVKETQNYSEIKQEAKFLAQSEVEPSIFQLKRRIEKERNKFWIRVFGKTMSWIPFVAKSFLAPTPDNIYKSVEKVYSDLGDIVDASDNATISKAAGISFLFSIENLIESTNA